MTDLKAVIFDLDGTLYESRHFPFYLITSDLPHMYILGMERISRKKIQGTYFPTAEDYYDELFKIMGDRPGITSEKARAWFWNRYMPSMIRIIHKRYTARHHAQELVEALKAKGLKVAVLSDYGMVNEKLMACGISPLWFDGVYEAPAMGGLKPCKETFLSVCKALGTEPGETLMIGDKVKTDGGALDAGLQFIHILKNEKQRGKYGEGYTEMLWDEYLKSNNIK